MKQRKQKALVVLFVMLFWNYIYYLIWQWLGFCNLAYKETPIAPNNKKVKAEQGVFNLSYDLHINTDHDKTHTAFL